MRGILFLALKDLKLLVRDRAGLFWIFGFPLLTALFFGAMFGGGPRGGSAIQVAVVDEDGSAPSKKFIAELEKSPSLRVQHLARAEAQDAVRRGRLTAYLLLAPGFGERVGFFGGTPPVVEVGMDPSRRAEEGYLQGLLMEAAVRLMQERFADPKSMTAEMRKSRDALAAAEGMPADQKELLRTFLSEAEKFFGQADAGVMREGPQWQPLKVEAKPVTREGTEPGSAYEITFPQSVVWGLFGAVTSFAVGMVVERKNGTLLRLRLAPLSRGQLLAGKGLACFLASVGITLVLLGVGRVVFGVRLSAPLGLAAAVGCSAVCFTGLMMFLSTLGSTEQGAAGAVSGVLLPLSMLGGGMIPLFVMPAWMQQVSHMSPVKWSILALEGAIWRSFGWAEMLLPCAVLLAVGTVSFGLGVWVLTKREA